MCTCLTICQHKTFDNLTLMPYIGSILMTARDSKQAQVRGAMRLPKPLADQIDQWRREHMPLRPWSEAIRRLLEEALAAYNKEEDK